MKTADFRSGSPQGCLLLLFCIWLHAGFCRIRYTAFSTIHLDIMDLQCSYQHCEQDPNIQSKNVVIGCRVHDCTEMDHTSYTTHEIACEISEQKRQDAFVAPSTLGGPSHQTSEPLSPSNGPPTSIICIRVDIVPQTSDHLSRITWSPSPHC